MVAKNQTEILNNKGLYHQIDGLIDSTDAANPIEIGNIALASDVAALADGKTDFGNGSGVRTAVTPSGAVSVTNAGAYTLQARVYSSSSLENPPVLYRHRVITLAEINAGFEVLATPPIGRTIHLQWVEVFCNGAFTTATTMQLENDLGATVLVYAQAEMTNGAYLNPDSTGVTINAGYRAGIGVGRSLRIEATGTFAGGTDITLKIAYSVHIAVI